MPESAQKIRQEATNVPNIPQIPPFAAQILQRLEEAGFRAFAVGGCVRDTLSGRKPHDWDVATDARGAQIAALFERALPTGIKYGTVTVLTDGHAVEITTFRTDGAYLDGRRPESVGFTASLEEDLKRRDFTVNAMAMDRRGRITDLHGGIEDLRRGILRCVGDPDRRFAEDALRMLRAVRFSAQLGFEIEPGTLEAVKRLSSLARRLSAERVRDELSGTLDSERPAYVKYMLEYGLLDAYLAGTGAGIPFERLAGARRGRGEIFAVLGEKYGACTDAPALLRSLRCPAAQARISAEASRLWGELRDEPMSLRAALGAHDPEPVLVAAGAAGFYASAVRELEARRFVRVEDLKVNGSDLARLGLRGPEIGATLRRLAAMSTAGTLENTRPTLLSAVQSTVYSPKSC